MIEFILSLLISAASAQSLQPDRYSIYAATPGIHTTHPQAVAVSVLIISGGGSGMGSRPNMSFTQAESHGYYTQPLPAAYAMYGRKGQTSCVDVLSPRTVTVGADQQTISWPSHGFSYDQPLFITGNQQTLWYVHAWTMTANSFKLSQLPFHPPGVRDPYVPYTFEPNATFELNPWAHCVLGGNGGGGIGDQAIAGIPRGIFFGNLPYPRSMYWYGTGGQNMVAGGGAGGGSYIGGGASPQIGGGNGNWGVDLQGGGGSGAGFIDPITGTYPYNQFGPGGGAGGTAAEISLPLKPSYKFYAAGKVVGGEPGPGGFRGGDGGMGLVMFKERIGP